MVLQYYAFYLYYVRKVLLKLCEDVSPPCYAISAFTLS